MTGWSNDTIRTIVLPSDAQPNDPRTEIGPDIPAGLAATPQYAWNSAIIQYFDVDTFHFEAIGVTTAAHPQGAGKPVYATGTVDPVAGVQFGDLEVNAAVGSLTRQLFTQDLSASGSMNVAGLVNFTGGFTPVVISMLQGGEISYGTEYNSGTPGIGRSLSRGNVCRERFAAGVLGTSTNTAGVFNTATWWTSAANVEAFAGRTYEVTFSAKVVPNVASGIAMFRFLEGATLRDMKEVETVVNGAGIPKQVTLLWQPPANYNGPVSLQIQGIAGAAGVAYQAVGSAANNVQWVRITDVGRQF